MKKRRLKRNVIIGAIAVVVVILGFIGYLIVTDLKQEDILRDEVSALAKKDITEHKGLSPIKTRGDYAKVEKLIKEYWNDCAKTFQNVMDLVNDSTLSNMLTIENYQADGPDFQKSKDYLAKAKETFNKGVEKINKMTQTDEIMKQIEKEKLDTYYVNLYRELMIGNAEDVSVKIEDTTIERVNNILTVEEQVIDLLIANKGKWSIQNDKIVFAETNTLNAYNELTKKLSQ